MKQDQTNIECVIFKKVLKNTRKIIQFSIMNYIEYKSNLFNTSHDRLI